MKIVRWFTLFMVIALLAATQNLAGATTLSVPAALPAEKIHRISVASDGTQGDGNSQSSAISEDGRFVAFSSAASNLVANDTNGPVPDARCIDPLPTASFNVLMKALGGHG